MVEFVGLDLDITQPTSVKKFNIIEQLSLYSNIP